MPLYKLFFYSSLFFILGIFIASIELPFWYAVLLILILFICLLFRFGWHPIILISLLILIGSFYYLIDDYRYYKNVHLVVGAEEFRGTIVTDPNRYEDYQSFYLKSLNNSSYPNIKILVKAKLTQKYLYGDELQIRGKFKSPPEGYFGKYLAKERISGTVNYPEITLLGSQNGSRIFSTLFYVKNYINESFRKTLNKDEAAFLSGITLGITSGFSKEMLDKFSLSGTRHLIAVSGFNMTIISTLFLTLFSYFLPRKFSFLLTAIAIIGFTAMIGFELSAVRAAIMGIIAGASRTIIGRPHLQYNAITFAALVMVLFNPKVLVYDLGFILSFLAVIAIIYLTPIILFIFNPSERKGFLDWKEMLAMTLAAQIATAPILITQFDNFSPISFVANILTLPAIPILTWVGFLMGALSFASITLEFLIGIIIGPILRYVLFIIDICSKFGVTLSPVLNSQIIVIYYAMLIYLIYEYHSSDKYHKSNIYEK